MTNSAAPDDVTVLAPASTVVPYQGDRIVVAPLRVGVIPQVIRELRPIIARVRPEGGDAGAFEIDISMDLLLDLLEHNAGNLFAAAGLCVGATEEYIAQGDPSELLALLIAIVEVNRDFFTRHVAPHLGSLGAQRRGAGAMPSSS